MNSKEQKLDAINKSEVHLSKVNSLLEQPVPSASLSYIWTHGQDPNWHQFVTHWRQSQSNKMFGWGTQLAQKPDFYPGGD